MKILVTGAAGFIGFHVCKRFIKAGIEVVGIDNLNSYYDINLKKNRIKELENLSKQLLISFKFYKGDIVQSKDLEKLFNDANKEKSKITEVIHLAAQAGVRYSLENPSAYIQSNLVGFFNIIEQSKKNCINNFYYASSSSVYGGNDKTPFEESDNVNQPISLYAATKKSNELIAHTYSHLFNLPTIGLRFFTVYGPWGRPDMATWIFTKKIINKEPIDVYNNGNMERDFTYIDDIVAGTISVLDSINKEGLKLSKVYNIGNNKPENLLSFISVIENYLNIKAIKKFKPIQPGDVIKTYADISDIKNDFNFLPTTSIKEGIPKFIDWYKLYHKL